MTGFGHIANARFYSALPLDFLEFFQAYDLKFLEPFTFVQFA